MSVRLNKLLAQRGIGARRKCDTLIQRGFVRVNGAVVTEPGTQVEPGRDAITVEGRPLPRAAEQRYFVLNKPVGVITTLNDPEGRRTVREFLPPGARFYPVGRLDADTSGLLILTNDGELAHHLMHPRYGVLKRYRVLLEQAPDTRQLGILQRGVTIEPGVRTAPAEVRVIDTTPGHGVIEIGLHEGRYRQVRRMCEAVGLAVKALHRYAYGPLRLGAIAKGMWRELSADEVAALKAAAARPVRGRVGWQSPRGRGPREPRRSQRPPERRVPRR
ncbi:MAG TPA: pseudouridine synthase, partial [Candidatus Eisenbacteria bacterium]|nr:pseudouridine synthase [Candidatus Eisenbacteria bacterium]